MKTNVNFNLIVHPQAENYRNQNRQLQAEAARLIVERDELCGIVVPQIEAEYRSVFGAAELRVFQYECEIRALIRRIEMAQSTLNHGEKPVYEEIEREIKIEFTAWREQIEAKAREIRMAKEREELPPMSDEDYREIKTLYRKLALILHEDLIGKSDERRRNLWLQAAEAYKCGDLQTLRTIRLIISSDAPETGESEKTSNLLDQLKNRHAELKTLCEKLLGEIFAVKSSPNYRLHEILNDETAVAQRLRALDEQLENLREKRLELVKHWSEIMHFAADAENIEIPAEPDDVFKENDAWTEIIYEF